MAVITISRELASEGDKIADAVCQELGYRRIEKAMLSEIAARAGVDVDAVLKMERSFAARSHLISTEMTSLYSKSPTAFDKKLVLDDKTYAEIVRKTLEEYATEGNVVIIGRGGQMVLRNWPGALHVHLYASADVRAQRLMARLNIGEQDARQRLTNSDEEKRQAIKHMYNNAEWKDLRYYHLAINTGVVSPEIAVQMIVSAARALDRAAAPR
jgi:cytidylate kinase